MRWILQSKIRIIGLIIVVLISGFLGYQNLVKAQNSKPQFQTAQAEKGSLITTVTASGAISQTNGTNLSTQATGTVANVYVHDGDMVTAGQKIADLNLDTVSLQKQASAWAAYLAAKNSLTSAQNSLNSLNSTMWQVQQKLIEDAVSRGLTTDDPTYIQQNSDWVKAETDYKNQQNVIAASQASLSSSWLSYSQLASAITASVSGKVSGLNLTPGMGVAADTVLGAITAVDSFPQAIVNLTEIDVVKVKPKQKAILSLDALPDKSFTGVVSAINTNGIVSSGVTTYPATITFDTSLDTIYPNMAVSVAIITNVKNDVVLVPSAAVSTSADGVTSVRVLKNGQEDSVSVEVGDANDTQTEITSGISEGDTVITGVVNSTNRTSATTSPFNTNRGFGGGGGVMIRNSR